MIAYWMGWLIAAGVLVVLEMFTGTFYLLMIAIGLGVGALAALAGAGAPLQAIAAAVVGVTATGLLHRSRFGRPGAARRGARPQRQPRYRPAPDRARMDRRPRARDVPRRAVGR